MRITWIGGWAIPEMYIRRLVVAAFPEYEHRVIYPGRDWVNKMKEATYDYLVGYSLGAHLLLRENENIIYRDILLVAPFIDLKREEKKGGRVAKTQLRVLRRNLERDALSAVNDFYIRAGLKQKVDRLPYSLEDLKYGIDILLENKELQCGVNCRSCIGDRDALINSSKLTQYIPNLETIENATHSLDTLLPRIRFNEI